MIRINPPSPITFSAAHSLSTQTFRQFFDNPLHTSYEGAILLAVAQSLYRNASTLADLPIQLPAEEPQTIEAAKQFLSSIKTLLETAQLSPLLSKNISDGIDLNSARQVSMTAVESTSLSLQQSTMVGYLGRRLVREAIGMQAPQHLVTDPKVVQQLIAEKVVYEVLPEKLDPQERRSSYERFHATDLAWAGNAYSQVMGLVSPTASEDLDRIYSKILSLNEEYRGLFFSSDDTISPQEYAQEEYRRALETRRLELKVETLEMQWQTILYNDIQNHFISKASPKEKEAFIKAFNHFKKTSATYIAYNENMVAGDEKARENNRKKEEEKCFIALWDLHDAALKILSHENKSIPITTFLWRNQAYRIDQGPTGMRTLEALYEITSRNSGVVKAAKRKEIIQERYDFLAATEWALPMLANIYSGIRIIGREADKSLLFRYRTPQGIENLQGADLLFSSQQHREPSQGSISAWDHTGAFDYCGIIGALYLFGLEPDSIIAEKVFNLIPVMRGHLLLTTGGFLDRKNPTATYEMMKNNIERGRSNALFDAGTRLPSFPFVSPYAPLDKKGSLLTPNEYIPRRNVAGMHVRFDHVPHAERLMMANNFHVGGVPSPDIPRDFKGFKSSHNMFGYSPLGMRSSFAVLARRFTPDQMPQHGSRLNAFQRRQTDVAILRAETTRLGFAADAGPFPRP